MSERSIQMACDSIDSQFGEAKRPYYRGVQLADLPHAYLVKLASGVYGLLDAAEERVHDERTRRLFARSVDRTWPTIIGFGFGLLAGWLYL